MTGLDRNRVKSLLAFSKQIEGSNKEFAKSRHIDALLVCVDKTHQGKGIATELINFAKQKADEAGVPLLFDTDMKAYADMYIHFGCKLYNSVTADNGVTRYSLCYHPGERKK
jgi:GNAT superfamily N-acetyltransferase